MLKSYKWMGWDWDGYGSQGGRRYRAPYGANNMHSLMQSGYRLSQYTTKYRVQKYEDRCKPCCFLKTLAGTFES